MSESGHSSERRFSRRKLLSAAGLLSLASFAGGALFRHISSSVRVDVESFTTVGSGHPKNILVVTGSGRSGGNSILLAEAFIKGARRAGHMVDVFHSAQNPMSACLHCGGCWTAGAPCVIRDSFDAFYPKLEEAELLVLCSPLYWYNFSGHLKCVLDRLYPYSQKDRLRDLKVREAMLLMCGESHFLRSFAGPAEAYRQMLGYKRWKDRGRLFVTGVDDLGAMVGNDALRVAEKMGQEA